MSLASGGEFPGRSLSVGELPTALAYDSVTFFPARTDYPMTFYGAVSANYLSRVGSLGDVASIGVTWSSTTSATGEITSTTTTTAATYSIGGASSIVGGFYRKDYITFNSSDPRGDFGWSGGFGMGDNAISNAYTVRLDVGYAEWTAYAGDESVSSGAISSSGGSVSFTIPGSQAIVMHAEPIISMSWGGGAGHFFSSTPYFPT